MRKRSALSVQIIINSHDMVMTATTDQEFTTGEPSFSTTTPWNIFFTSEDDNTSFTTAVGNFSGGGGPDLFSVDTGIDLENGILGLVLAFMIFVPNLLAVVVILASGRYRNHGDWLILAVCALNVPSSFLMSIVALMKYFTGVYPGRTRVCYMQAFALIFQNSVNLLTIVALSFERCLAMTKPFWYRARLMNDRRFAIALLVFIYCTSAVYSTLPLVGSNVGHVALSYSFCSVHWGNPDNRTLSIVTASMAITLTAMIIVFDGLTVRSSWRIQRGNFKDNLSKRHASVNSSSYSAERTSTGRRSSIVPLTRFRRGSNDGGETSHGTRSALTSSTWSDDSSQQTTIVIVVTCLYVACFIPTIVSMY